jgi:hypothetical protein
MSGARRESVGAAPVAAPASSALYSERSPVEIMIRGHGWTILHADPGPEHRDHEGAHGGHLLEAPRGQGATPEDVGS